MQVRSDGQDSGNTPHPPTDRTPLAGCGLPPPLAAAQQLLDGGARLLTAEALAQAANVSPVTVRAHWDAIAARLHLRRLQQRRALVIGGGRTRRYTRAVLLRCGRAVPESSDQADSSTTLTCLFPCGGPADTRRTAADRAPHPACAGPHAPPTLAAPAADRAADRRAGEQAQRCAEKAACRTLWWFRQGQDQGALCLLLS